MDLLPFQLKVATWVKYLPVSILTKGTRFLPGTVFLAELISRYIPEST